MEGVALRWVIVTILSPGTAEWATKLPPPAPAQHLIWPEITSFQVQMGPIQSGLTGGILFCVEEGQGVGSVGWHCNIDGRRSLAGMEQECLGRRRRSNALCFCRLADQHEGTSRLSMSSEVCHVMATQRTCVRQG